MKNKNYKNSESTIPIWTASKRDKKVYICFNGSHCSFPVALQKPGFALLGPYLELLGLYFERLGLYFELLGLYFDMLGLYFELLGL